MSDSRHVRREPSLDVDLLVIGTGNAGQAAIEPALAAKWRVAMVDHREVGGTCALRGCVPKKVMLAAAEVLDGVSRAEVHGISVGSVRLDWEALIRRTQSFVEDVPASVAEGLRGRGVQLLDGRAKFIGPNRVAVGERVVTAAKVVVATGSRPRRPTFPGAEAMIDSDDFFTHTQRPASVVCVGGGAIVLEFVHLLARIGTKVTVLEAKSRLLGEMDIDAVDRLLAQTRSLGVEIITDVEVQRIERGDASLIVHYRKRGSRGDEGQPAGQLAQASGQVYQAAAQVVFNGTGRDADVESLDLEAAGIDHDGARVLLDRHLRSVSNRSIWFAGDAVATRPKLSPLATHDGGIAGYNAVCVDEREFRVPEDRVIPAVLHTIPCLASVGLTPEAARKKGVTYEVRQHEMQDWRSGRTFAETLSFAKILVDHDRILGAHLLGHGGAEVIHLVTMAMKHDIRVSQLREMVYAYPTYASDLRHLLA